VEYRKIRYATKNDIVYNLIKEKILDGEFKLGSQLIIRNLAKEFNVSETPVREAIKRLEVEGLVEVTPHVGITVSVPSLEKTKEILNVRLILEPKATEMFIENLSDKALKELDDILNDMKEAAKEKDVKKYSLLDKEFHDIIYKFCGNEVLYEIITNLWGRSERTRSVFGISVERMNISLGDHIKLLDSIKKKDKKTAVEVVKSHKEQSFKILLEYVISYYKGMEMDKYLL
jgi:DNA-binding GntR family transcriptional regulator